MDTPETDDRIIRHFAQHLVGLIVYFKWDTDDSSVPDRVSVASGTLIIVENMLYFLTAGHVLKELDELRSHARVKISSARLADIFGSQAVSKIPIPFDLASARLFYIDDDNLGFDFGVIHLGPLYVNLLARNGMIALAEQNWIHQSKISFDRYLLLGFPAEGVSVLPTGEVRILHTLFPVERVGPPPASAPTTTYPRFIGRLLSDDLGVASLKGTSGGPIFGLSRKDGQLRYWVVGLQSTWNPQTRLIYGCPLPELAAWMTEAARTVTSEPLNE